MLDTTALYDAFGQDYDRFVDWDARLAFEMPFLQARLQAHGVSRVLDMACGTGQHAIALAHAGYEVTAADLSAGMVARARANAAAAGVPLRVWQLGFGELERHVSARADQPPETDSQPFDAILCLGNSLPHLLTEAQMVRALRDMAQALKSEGILIVQLRNFRRVLDRQERFMPPESHASEDGEWVFFRFYDMQPTVDEGTQLQFNVVRLSRAEDGNWACQVGRTWLRAWPHEELSPLLPRAGLRLLSVHGSLSGEAFDPSASSDLVWIAQAFPG
jgi:glycine/sarcosine N-methyltransferase